MNGAAAAAAEQSNGLTSPTSKPANGMSVVRNGSTASDIDDEEVRAELEEEVQDLRDDRTYHDFIHNVVDNKKIAEEDENSDEDFIVEDEEDGEEGEEKEGEEGSDGDESSLSDFDEDEKVVDCAAGGDVVKIPKEALRDAEKRFPHFWRTKHAIKTQYREDDYEEEQDSDYEPDNDKEAANLDDTQDEETAEGAVLETSGKEDDWRKTDEVELDSDNEKEDSEDEDDPEVMKAELDELHAEKEKDLKGDVDGLVEMVEYMTVVNQPESESDVTPVDVADTAAAAGSDNEVAEEDDDSGATADDEGEEMQTQTIGELELDGYVSEEDPDFPRPSREEWDAAEDSQPDTDDEMTVERMQ